jgi:hypothetical protein
MLSGLHDIFRAGPIHRTLAQHLLKPETVSGSMVKKALENSPGPPADAGHLEVSFQAAS